MAKCVEKDCPANLATPPQEHLTGDNECGYLNADEGPLSKNDKDRYFSCRRPGCYRTHLNAERRNQHEADEKAHHRTPGAMNFICDWAGHADALQDAGFCPVCQ